MDMSSLFRGVIQTCFPNAIIVADRYHVVRQAVWAMENVRKNVQKKLSPEWRKFFKRSQCLLNKSHVRIAYKTSSTSILFLQHIIESLANGGRCAMVIDEGVLFRTNEEAYVKTKRKLLDDCNLHTIISLPAGLFSSAGAGVKTNILLAISDLLWYVSCQRRRNNGKHHRRTVLRQYHPIGA